MLNSRKPLWGKKRTHCVMIKHNTKSGNLGKKRENASLKIYKLFCTEINLKHYQNSCKTNLKILFNKSLGRVRGEEQSLKAHQQEHWADTVQFYTHLGLYSPPCFHHFGHLHFHLYLCWDHQDSQQIQRLVLYFPHF